MIHLHLHASQVCKKVLTADDIVDGNAVWKKFKLLFQLLFDLSLDH